MAAATSASTPPTPPTSLPAFARITSASLLRRNASNSSSRSTTTSESTSSLVAVPIRPPPIQTRTAATPDAQLYDTSDLSDYGGAADRHPQTAYGGRGFMHNGPRMSRQSTMPPAIVATSPDAVAPPHRSPSLPPNASISPTTPRASHLILPMDGLPSHAPTSAGQLRMTIQNDLDAEPRPSSAPSTPTATRTTRARSVNDVDPAEQRERRQSGLSTHSNGSATSRRPQLRDFVLGEELGRGSYSTVVAATQTAMPRIPYDVAIKIMNQMHLIQEKKAKYAHIERDALIRLAQPRPSGSPTLRVGHRRGMSSSSSGGGAAAVRKSNQAFSARRDSNSSNPPPSGGLRERQLSASDGYSPRTSTAPLSPLMATSRRLQASDSQEILDERSGTPGLSSRPPSPVQEESHDGHLADQGSGSEPDHLHPTISSSSSFPDAQRPRTPRKRRQSLAQSERSTRSSAGTVSGPAPTFGHPGVIHLYCTFADKTSVYYVLECAHNGELAAVIRKFGSLDLESVRYYAAQLIDTIEYIHEREIIHRDLKPENILLDKDMRIKVTDFGSAKIMGRKEEAAETSKRSFVGSADYVSPEVLRNEPPSTASDIWAFGVVLYDFITGKSPFRSATEFLTFQKVLQRELVFPEGFDPEAQSLVELLLDLNPAKRPTAAQVKQHPFFASIDWSTIWTIPAPTVRTGLVAPQQSSGPMLDSSVWAEFDDQISDAEFESPDEHDDLRYDRYAAADAVAAVDRHFPVRQQSLSPESDSLDPPRRAWLEGDEEQRQPKVRGWSTSSSSSGGRLSGWLESMGINTPPGKRVDSSRASRHSDRSEDRGRLDIDGSRSPRVHSRANSPDAGRSFGLSASDNSRWMPLMVANERIILSTPIMTKPSNNVPAFLLPASKRRQLILTDLPRLLEVKDDPESGAPKVKRQFGFVQHQRNVPPATVRSATSIPGDDVGLMYVLEVQDKSNKAFVLQTATQSYTFQADTPDIRAAWLNVLKKVV